MKVQVNKNPFFPYFFMEEQDVEMHGLNLKTEHGDVKIEKMAQVQAFLYKYLTFGVISIMFFRFPHVNQVEMTAFFTGIILGFISLKRGFLHPFISLLTYSFFIYYFLKAHDDNFGFFVFVLASYHLFFAVWLRVVRDIKSSELDRWYKIKNVPGYYYARIEK